MLGAAQDQLAPIRLSGHTLDKATKAKVTLENYYSNLIAQNVERQQRLAKLEETLRDEGLSETQKQEKRQQHAIKETEFLRLKRSRLGVEDFEPLKGTVLLSINFFNVFLNFNFFRFFLIKINKCQ
jgi:serine/threonine kinase 38